MLLETRFSAYRDTSHAKSIKYIIVKNMHDHTLPKQTWTLDGRYKKEEEQNPLVWLGLWFKKWGVKDLLELLG